MAKIFSSGGDSGGPSKAEIARQEKERVRLADIETKKTAALKRARRGRQSLISGDSTGEKSSTLG